MHRLSASFILGYHGCDAKVAEALLAGEPFTASTNTYDWLGPGIYFWEANPERGMDFAREVSGRKGSKIKTPAVVGAVIDLGLCLDLTTLSAVQKVESAYKGLCATLAQAGEEPARNSKDLLRRPLDCQVIRYLHEILKDADEEPLDTIRGIFIEGDPIYPASGFFAKTHVQIAVVNPACIKGVFRVR